MIKFIYNYLFIPLIRGLFPLLKLLMPKFAKRDNFPDFSKLTPCLSPSKKTILFHSASMGEFEQAKPVIEYLNRSNDFNIVCSFYSPSGYENQKNYTEADYIYYLPFDTRKNARQFVESVKPDIAVFIRYDLWLNHLLELQKRSIPTLLICATKPQSSFLTPYLKKVYSIPEKIMTMSETDSQYFRNLLPNSDIETGADTRFDRVISVVEKNIKSPLLPGAPEEECLTLVAGSTWKPDEEIIVEAVKMFNSDAERRIRVIYVPHEPNRKNVSRLAEMLDNPIYLGQYDMQSPDYTRDIIVDTVGKLLGLYANADIAYIGGAFGSGVHSVTEPAGYGIPLMTGPDISGSPDAKALKREGTLKTVANAEQLTNYFRELTSNKELFSKVAGRAKEYVYSSRGSSKRAAELIAGMLK